MANVLARGLFVFIHSSSFAAHSRAFYASSEGMSNPLSVSTEDEHFTSSLKEYSWFSYHLLFQSGEVSMLAAMLAAMFLDDKTRHTDDSHFPPKFPGKRGSYALTGR